MRKLKIAQVVSMEESVPPKSKNGLEFVVSWITEELINRGHSVTLFAPSESKTKSKLFSLFPKGVNKDRTKAWSQPVHSLWNTTLAATMSKDFDIIHSHTGTIAFNMPFIETPVIQTLHEPYRDVFRKNYLKNKKYLGNIAFILKQYKKINYVCVSQSQEKNFKKLEKYYFKNHFVIKNGIAVEKFSFNDKPEDYLLFLGYINKNKGADIALKVAKKLKMKLILAGDMFGEEEFFKKEIKPFLGKNIKYVGSVNFKEKNKLYKNAIATLAPINWNEPFGLTIVESQACGTPVIAFRKGASEEIIKNGQTGFVVNNIDHMIAALQKIETIDRKKCREWVEKNFDINRMVDEYEDLYYKLAKIK